MYNMTMQSKDFLNLFYFYFSAEQLSYDIALDLTLYLDQENDYVPWDAAYGNFWWLNEILRFQPAYRDWRVSVLPKDVIRLDEA